MTCSGLVWAILAITGATFLLTIVMIFAAAKTVRQVNFKHRGIEKQRDPLPIPHSNR